MQVPGGLVMRHDPLLPTQAHISTMPKTCHASMHPTEDPPPGGVLVEPLYDQLTTRTTGPFCTTPDYSGLELSMTDAGCRSANSGRSGLIEQPGRTTFAATDGGNPVWQTIVVGVGATNK